MHDLLEKARVTNHSLRILIEVLKSQLMITKKCGQAKDEEILAPSKQKNK